jgi:hypothetical protein
MRKRLVSVLACLAMLLLGALPARATEASDPDDVAGKLDVQTLAGTKSAASDPLHITVATYENWAKGALRVSGSNRVIVLFNVDSDHNREYKGVITSSGGHLSMTMTGEGSTFEPLKVRHPNGHTLKTTIPGGAPMNPDGTVSIAVKTRFTDQGDCSDTCSDRAPNGGWLAIALA